MPELFYCAETKGIIHQWELLNILKRLEKLQGAEGTLNIGDSQIKIGVECGVSSNYFLE